MAAGSWTVPQVVALINRYKLSRAQMVVDGKPFVSTFEGPGWAENWPVVRGEIGGIFLIPDWSSLGPFGVGEKLDLIDGACEFLTPKDKVRLLTRRPVSWDAWPKAGSTKMTTIEDVLYKENLRGKKYMMPVSPCLYTSESPAFLCLFHG
jgi:glucan endo-1,3-alpha-glucosidase